MNTNYSYAGKREALSTDDLRRKAPSIFAENAHHEVSDRYSFVSTLEIVETLRDNGWSPVSVQEQTVRKEDRRGFQRHLIRYQRTGENKPAVVGDSVFELACINSHDRSSGIQFFGGLFRFICANGLCVADSLVGRISLRHTGVDQEALVRAALGIANQVPKIEAVVGDWQAYRLNDVQQSAFAQAAAVARYGDEIPFHPRALLAPRRSGDAGCDLWSTFNRVQENLISGKRLHWTDQNRLGEEGRTVRTVREVKGIDTNVKLNKALWTLAEALRNGGSLNQVQEAEVVE